MAARVAILLLTLAASPVLAAPAPDLAVGHMRVPTRVHLTGSRATASFLATVRIENRGTTPIVFTDAATFLAAVHLRAEALAGPIFCPPLDVVPRVRRIHFPLTIRPHRGRAVRFLIKFTCGANPDQTPDWVFRATVDHSALDGTADADSTDDTCPRAPNGADPGCGGATTDVHDTRAGLRFELPGPYGVGETSLTLVDPSRPTMPNGTFPGAPERTLPTVVWYPTAPGAGGVDAALATNRRPFPLVVFAHALGSYNRQSTFLMRHLASHGYVVASPEFPLSHLGTPGGATVADVPAQAGDVSFVIDSMLRLSVDAGSRFAGGVDAGRIGVSGHSGGALTTLVATYDANLHDARIQAAVPLAPPSCFFQAGYFDAARVPLLILQGDHDLLLDASANAEAVFAHAHAPKALILVQGGNHLGFADAGVTFGDDFVCTLFPDQADLEAQIAVMLQTLGGSADHVSDGCLGTYCTGDTTHIDGRRQEQIAEETVLAFFEEVLRADRVARRYLHRLAARNPDLSLTLDLGR